MRALRIFLVLLPLSLAASHATAGEEKGNLTLDARVGLNAYAALVDQELYSARNGLRVLAATENAVSGDWNRIKGPMAKFAEGVPARAAVWFARPDGAYFTITSGMTTQNLKDRGYFPGLMAGNEVLGDLVVSKSTGKRSAIIAVPVKKAGHVIGAIGLSLSLEKVAAWVEDRIAFPPRVMFYALDRKGQTALHRQSNLLFDFAAKSGSQSLADAIKVMLSENEGIVHYEFQGARRTAIFEKSGLTGWVYALRW